MRSTIAATTSTSAAPGARDRSSFSSWRCSPASTCAELAHNSADYIHLVTEAAKLAFADREQYYGDPDFVDVPLAALLSEAYNAGRRRAHRSRARLARAASRRRARRYAAPRGRRDLRRPRLGTRHRLRRRSSTASATWRRSPRAAPGSPPHRSSTGSASRSARACRRSISILAIRTRSCPASVRAPRSPRRWCCATARRAWSSGRRAATSRISGRCRSF